MARPLVIVESLAKARTLECLLGPEYRVCATKGPVRDLARGRLAVDPSRVFAAEYEVLPARRRLVAALREAARESAELLLAGDPDREGEEYCWHLAEELATVTKGRPPRRVVLHEITRRAVEEAFASPREIDQKVVDAAQTRRILDRLVGHGLGLLLRAELRPDLSIGHEQAIALRILADREREIAGFQPRDQGRVPAGRRLPPPPFVTSTLLPEAFRRLRFPVRKTMRIARRLYEGLDLGGPAPTGLTTYPRTASSRAAIRPTDPARDPRSLSDRLDRDDLALYGLIHERLLASQGSPAVGDQPIGEERRPEPPRFTEASLVEELERRGVGHAARSDEILAGLSSALVKKTKGRITPTPLGLAVSDLMAERLPDLTSAAKSAAIEAEIDAVEGGRATKLGTLARLWREIEPALAAARVRATAPRRAASRPLAERARGIGLSCPRCHEGRVVERRAEERLFYGCGRFPACRFTSTHKPIAESCPECGRAFMLEKQTKRDGRVVYCGNEACRHRHLG